MRTTKGFTLIELMIVISVIGILGMAVVPRVGSVKTQSKNQSVATNVMLVRFFIENRGARDAIALNTALLAGRSYSESMGSILSGVKSEMTQFFSGSNAIQNPFNNIESINYSQQDVRLNSPTSASVVLGYSGDANASLPADNNISNTLPKGNNFIGDVVVIIYRTGYVIYGVDNNGDIINTNIIKFPPIPAAVQSGTGGGNGGSPGGINNGGTTPSGVMGNVGDVVTYIRSIATDRILRGEPLGQIWNVMKGPLDNDLRTQFTPGNAAKRLVNPFNNSDSIVIDYRNSNNTGNYAIISVHDADDVTNEDTKFSNKPGTVIVYVTSNPVGYVVYGVDQDGRNVGYTAINLSTMVTPEMTQALSNNVTTVYNILKTNINTLAVGNQGDMSNAAFNALRNLNIKNAYWPSWNRVGTFSSDSFIQGHALMVSGWNMEGANYRDFKGSVAVNVLRDGTGYEIFGIDYAGNRYAYIKAVR